MFKLHVCKQPSILSFSVAFGIEYGDIHKKRSVTVHRYLCQGIRYLISQEETEEERKNRHLRVLLLLSMISA